MKKATIKKVSEWLRDERLHVLVEYESGRKVDYDYTPETVRDFKTRVSLGSGRVFSTNDIHSLYDGAVLVWEV